MKYAVLASRILLGLAFTIFGANILFPFLPVPPMPPSDATTFSTILMQHKVMAFVGLLQLVGGILLLVGRYVPLALTLLAPVIVNILLFHILIAGGGATAGLVVAVFETFLLFAYRRSFYGLFDSSPEVS